MNYHYNGDTYKIVKEGRIFKVYYITESKWSTNKTFIGKYNTQDKAQNAARKYSN